MADQVRPFDNPQLVDVGEFENGGRIGEDDGRNGAETIELEQQGQHPSRPVSPLSPTTLHPPLNRVSFSRNTSRQSVTSVWEGMKIVVPTRKKEMHWVSRKIMISCYLISLMLGHHFWYNSLVGQDIGNNFAQQRTRLLGNFFPWMVQVFLAVSIEIAFTQYLFLCLRKRPVTVSCLDAAYEATSSLLFMFNKEMIRVLPEVSALALLIGLLTIPTTMVTPGTLLVNQSLKYYSTEANVSQLAISSSDHKQTGYFYVSRPAYGANSADNSSVLFLGPRTIISRLSTAAGATGEILQISSPGVNSSYLISFQGPYVQCEEANDTISNLIEATILSDNTDSNGTVQEIYNSYYAYVPDLSSLGQWGSQNTRDIDASKSSNQLWLSFKQNGTGWTESPYPKCPLTTHRVCQLYNASYNLNVTFENGNMTVSYPQPEVLNIVNYPTAVVNATIPEERIKMAYSAYMWSLTDLLTGSLGLYLEDVVQDGMAYKSNFTAILSNIQNTALLGSADLDCQFALDWMYQGVSWRPPTLQRELDIDFADNRTLDVLIPELSANLTIGLMTNPLLAPNVWTTVQMSTPIDVYGYHFSTLLISYGVTLFAASVALCLGLIAFHYNEVVMDKAFSTIASATQHTHLLDETHYTRRGSVPIPRTVRQQRVLFKKLDTGGGWGFTVEPMELDPAE